MDNRKLTSLAALLIASAFAGSAIVRAEPAAQPVALHIPAQPASTALKAFVEQTRFQLIYAPDVVEGVTTQAVSGMFIPSQALAKLLEGTGITVARTGKSAATLLRKPAGNNKASISKKESHE